eukprot:gene39681-48314_t
MICPDQVPDQVIADAVAQRVCLSAPAVDQPAWFQPAMKAALAQALAPVQATLLNARILDANHLAGQAGGGLGLKALQRERPGPCQLTALSEFYGIPFGPRGAPLHTRKAHFEYFIGVSKYPPPDV